MRHRALPAAALLSLLASVTLLPTAGLGQEAGTRYLAFGDSITFGIGDDPARAEAGYPPRLEDLLAERGQTATVENFGIPGETTAEGLARIDDVLAQGGDELLLMEGTNDINARVSPETTQFNLAQMAARAAVLGISTLHITVPPRLPSANFDGGNRVTAQVNGLVRDLAWQNDRVLADPFEVFLFHTPGGFEQLYGGGEDKLHPNAAGYDLMAQVIADAITGPDSVPPVPGRVFPEDDQQEVPPDTEIQVDLYDFGTGIDIGATDLLIDGAPVDAQVSGDERKLELRYTAPEPLSGVVFVGIRSQDLASPPNTVDRDLVQFVVAGTQFFAGDIDRDGRVDGADLVAFAVRFGSVDGDGRYRLFADFNGDGVIDGQDLAVLASNFGKSSS